MAEVISADEMHSEMPLSLEEIEWTKVQEIGYKTGYVDGITLGGESKLQRGFDRGYENGFETSYSISIIRGLLAVNEIRLKETKSPLLGRALQIKKSLIEFEKKCNDLKMKNLGTTKSKESTDIDPDVATGIRNLNIEATMTTTSASEENVGIENKNIFEDFNLNNNQLNEVTQNLKELKMEILNFLEECSQPLILDQLREGKCSCKWKKMCNN